MLAGVPQSADQENWDVGRSRVFFKTSTQLETVNNRHDDVADYDIRSTRKGKTEPFLSVPGSGNLAAFFLHEVD